MRRPVFFIFGLVIFVINGHNGLLFGDDAARLKRDVKENLEIETMVVLDSDYVARMEASGHDSDESLKELVRLKWAGAQAEWGKADILGYNVTLSIKDIEIWRKNPDWYTPSEKLDYVLYSFCNGAKDNELGENFDYLYLFTGKQNTDVAGKAYTAGMCTSGRNCAVSSFTSVTEYYITAHEIGHSIGMTFDANVGCESPSDGIMGGKTAGWSNCSVNALVVAAQDGLKCLRSEDVTYSEGISVPNVWPGMLYTDDEICEFYYGPGFRQTSARGSCNGITCTNLDPQSLKYGVSFWRPTPTDGSYCGDKMVCSTQITNGQYQCISWAATGLRSELFTKVPGGWSDFTEVTACSRSCGSGVLYRQRSCNNPKPKNSAWCQGSEYEAEVCNSEPCAGDSNEPDELVRQRAGETCAQWKANMVYASIGKDSSNYLNTGNKYGGSGNDQCAVQCDTVPGYNGKQERHGLMPDGTPCDHDSLSSFVEINGLPRRSGMRGRCLKGKCVLFDCDGATGSKKKDACGVCGGDSSSCQVVEGVFSKNVVQKSSALIAVLPAKSRLIQFYFKYGDMKNHFFEVRTKDSNTAVINYRALDTTDNPVTFAGTYWYLKANKQYLYAEGPTNQAVYIQLYNLGANNNAGVNYAYTLPKANEMSSCSGNCANGGTWNKTTCSCDCAKKFYGIDCTDKCSTFCKNSQVTATTCKCDCKGNTYGTSCDCLNPFTGIDCKDCKINSCKNGGTFDPVQCRCTCPPGYGDLDCSAPCKDAGNTAKCQKKEKKGHCSSQNEQMEQDCYLTCGLCVPA